MNRLVVISNRVAVRRNDRGAGGGLEVGVRAALRGTGGLWFGWDGNTREHSPSKVSTILHDSITYATISLSRQDYEHYYKGYSNRVLWPLFHSRLNLVKFRREFRYGYERVNTLFAKRLLPLLGNDDILWVNDFHLIPLATGLRQAGATQLIGFFLHIPFPPFDVFRALPDYEWLLQQLCAYDLVGFQTDLDQHAFHDCLKLALGASSRGSNAVIVDGRRINTGVFPIGIDIDEVVTLALSGRASKQAKSLVESLGERPLVTGVDRLDYSKGLVERFHAFERLLVIYPEFCGNVVFMQVAQPSRSDVPEYKEIRRLLEAVAGEIDGRFADYDWNPLRYLNKSFGRKTIMGFLASSKVGLVTPLRDGMNLVAKEFIASQDPADPGVLVLSHLTGAARELCSAIIVNPYDADDVADGIARALAMPLSERKERWQDAMKILRKNDIHAWQRHFIRRLKQCA